MIQPCLTAAAVAGPNAITETFVFTNNTQESIFDLLFSDCYNFHADGSFNLTDTACPTTTYDPVTGTVTTVGNSSGTCSPIVKNGSIHGSQLPSNWDLGLAAAALHLRTLFRRAV